MQKRSATTLNLGGHSGVCSAAARTPTVRDDFVFTKLDFAVFAGLSVVAVSVIVEFALWWGRLPSWRVAPAGMLVFTLLLFLGIALSQARWFLLPLMKRPRPMPAAPGWRVGVVTTFVPGVESIQMLADTLRALVRMEYPHDTWVLDEGDDADVRELCRSLGALHFSRKGLQQYQSPSGTFQAKSKHGNFNAWLHAAGFDRYDILVSFDPDHVPVPRYLTRVLGYFGDPSVGYVQCPQAYYNQSASFIARGAAEETYAYYSSTQMASYGLGYPVVTGCHTAQRVSALKQVGGFAAHDADDLLITILYRASGWRGIYHPEILAEGITPVDWHGYLRQQLRWCRSILDIKFHLYPRLAGRLPAVSAAIGLLHGSNYILESVATLPHLLLLVFFLLSGRVPDEIGPIFARIAGLALVLHLCELYRQRFYLGGSRERGWHWRAGLLQFAKWPYQLQALCQALARRRVPYTLTSKALSSAPAGLTLWPHLAAAGAVFSAWTAGALHHSMHPFLHVWALSSVAASLGIFLSQFRAFPPPFDPALRARPRAR